MQLFDAAAYLKTISAALAMLDMRREHIFL